MEEIKVADLVFKAHRLPSKTVRKCTPTSGAIYLHKSLIGKTFDVILIPTSQQVEETERSPQVEDEVKKAEESLKRNLEELKN